MSKSSTSETENNNRRPKGNGLVPPRRSAKRDLLARDVESLNKLAKWMEREFTAGAQGSLFYCYRIGLVVQRAQARAGKKKKTEAVKRLAEHPDVRLSQPTLYRYLRLVNELPKTLGIPPEEFLAVRKKSHFVALVGELTLVDAMAMITGKNGHPLMLEGPPPKADERSTPIEELPTTNNEDINWELTDNVFLTPEKKQDFIGTQLNALKGTAVHAGEPPQHDNGLDDGEDAREGEDSIPSPAVSAQDEVAYETATAVEPSSCHLLCDDRDLPQALKFLEANGFSFHSTNVACPKHQRHLFLVSGVRGGAVPATSEFCTWFVCDTAEEVLDQMVQRLAEMWPGRSLELFSS